VKAIGSCSLLLLSEEVEEARAEADVFLLLIGFR
jgi:hypothetical protein